MVLKPKKKIREKSKKRKKLSSPESLPLSKPDTKRLSILNEKIEECNKCPNIRKNGIAVPSWSSETKYGIILEAPGKDEIEIGKLRHFPPDPITEGRVGTPLVGRAGKLMWIEIEKITGLHREDFLVINSTQCRPVRSDGRNGKPSFKEIENCKFWIEKYIKYSGIRKLLVCGNLAYHTFTGISSGITNRCGGVDTIGFKGMALDIFPCVHPASVLYSEDNRKLLQQSLEVFRMGTVLDLAFNQV